LIGTDKNCIEAKQLIAETKNQIAGREPMKEISADVKKLAADKRI